MSSLAFVTHPSVRIKGTENSYTPSQCLDERCPVKAPHLHCPFCVKTDAYQDPVILKAHYRVKHVDKGIEFAGLKILRCCDQCDIIGIIKGEKRFKGAHWHCYRCRNGFNRRDEAIKHYKTHFRNPQTTFQIQITQDLNSPPEVRPHEELSVSQDAFASIENPIQEIIHPSLSQTGITTEQNVITTGTRRSVGGVKKIKVRHELLTKDDSGDHEDEETIMIIQGDPESAFANHLLSSGELTVLNRTVDPNLSWEIRFRLEEEEKNIYKAKAEEYKAQVELLQQQVVDLEAQLAQQNQLKLQELADILNSGDVSKQGLGQQLIKFLEQCQLQTQASITVLEDEPDKQHEHLKHEVSILHELEHNPSALADSLKAVHSHSQHLDAEGNTVTHLSEIPDGYQVVCTTSEGHVVVAHAADAAVTSPLSEGEGISSAECIDGCSSAAVSESSEVLFTHVIGSHIKQELPDLSDAGVMAQVGGRELSEVTDDHGCLLEVVAAADGLASLGTDIAVVTSGSECHEHQPEFVEGVDKERVTLITEENNLEVGEQIGTEHSIETEPPAKRLKMT
ncbi:unnamed protein product [Candidula unifasciata]|uniref:C2H2-type domain-containing protein n=1 Tax=Candidula unifasciata TaxID=100452 RepID=A0A8S3Z1N5_9EUPU|nr:unnamed protein product [Candidula unifasciata]